MATPTTREELKQYALRKLGAPVIEINVDDAQLEDSLDDAIQIFNEYHFDGVERALYKHEITQTDIDNGFIDTDTLGLTGPNDYPQAESGTRIVSVTKAFQFDEGGAGTNMFSIRYQMALNDSYGLRYGGDMANYYITQSYIKLHPDNYTEIYNDILLKKYVTASFKKQWGMNLSKYQNISLPGGVQFNADQLMSSANEEMNQIEETLQDKYELPPDFFTG